MLTNRRISLFRRMLSTAPSDMASISEAPTAATTVQTDDETQPPTRLRKKNFEIPKKSLVNLNVHDAINKLKEVTEIFYM
jgi:hypothetical protein